MDGRMINCLYFGILRTLNELNKIFQQLTDWPKFRLIEEDWSEIVQLQIDREMIKSAWRTVEVSICKTNTNLINLTDAFDQSALASRSF